MPKERLRRALADMEREYREKFGTAVTVSDTPAMKGVTFAYALDISRCIGCRRCVYACVAENNQSRDPQVHWIRVLEMEKEKGIDAVPVPKLGVSRPNLMDAIKSGQVHLLVNTPSGHKEEGVNGAVYVQDSWRLTNRLTVNPGIRWSSEYITGASGRTAHDFLNEWQPRIGASWQLDRAGTHRLFASYGRYYQQELLNLPAIYFVDFLGYQNYYATDPRKPGAVVIDSIDFSAAESKFAGKVSNTTVENFQMGCELMYEIVRRMVT